MQKSTERILVISNVAMLGLIALVAYQVVVRGQPARAPGTSDAPAAPKKMPWEGVPQKHVVIDVPPPPPPPPPRDPVWKTFFRNDRPLPVALGSVPDDAQNLDKFIAAAHLDKEREQQLRALFGRHRERLEQLGDRLLHDNRWDEAAMANERKAFWEEVKRIAPPVAGATIPSSVQASGSR